METYKFLVIGDTEGRVRSSSIAKLAERFLQKGDFIILTGDYFSNQLTELYFFKTGVAFPEKSTIGNLYQKYKVVTAYGNKDLQSKIFSFDKVRSRLGIVSVEDFYGEREVGDLKFCFVNGSNVTNINFSKKAELMKTDIDVLLAKYERLLKGNYKGRLRLRDLPDDEIQKLREKYGETFKIAFDYPYISNYLWLESKQSDADILLTHSPPLLSEKAKILAGYSPDTAVFKEVGKGVEPTHPKENGAKKMHVGLPQIEDFCKRGGFKIVFCGHIHEASGIALYGSMLIVNAGSKLAKMNIQNILPFVLLEVDKNFTKFKCMLYNWDGTTKVEGVLR